MYSGRTGKLYNVLQIDIDDEITPELIELMKHYEGVIFTNPNFNESLDCIPHNVKYIDISAARSYKKPFTNLHSSLIGIAFSANLPANNTLNDFAYLQYGIKIVYFAPNNIGWKIEEIMDVLPPSVEYISLSYETYIVDIANNEVKKILTNDIHTRRSHIIFDVPFHSRYNYPMGFVKGE